VIDTRKQFRFRTRTLTAIATPVNNVHPNVIRLNMQPSIVQSVLRAVIGCMPSAAQVWFRSSFPEWTLPPRLVLKKMKKGWDDEFDTEKATYAKLHSLQGVIIPKLFGELRYGNNTRALLMSDIGGASLATPEGGMLGLDEFKRLIHQALGAFSHFRITQDDVKLDNFHLVDGKIMVVDLESVNEDLSDEDFEFLVHCAVTSLSEFYERNQYGFWQRGLLKIATSSKVFTMFSPPYSTYLGMTGPITSPVTNGAIENIPPVRSSCIHGPAHGA